MELKEMIKVMQHFEDGGEVEYSYHSRKKILGTVNKEYTSWNWDTYTYHIKEPKQKVTIEKWLCLSSNKEYYIKEAESIHLQYANKFKLLETYEVEL